MKRKVIELGNQSSVVSLPKKWVRANGLKKGDEVDITLTDTTLVIAAKPTPPKATKTIALASTNPSYLRSVIASAYKAGYDEIILQFAQTPKMQDINEIINSFTGLEVVAQTKDSITIKSFLTITKEEVDNLIIKMFQSTKLILSTLDEEWEKTNLSNLKSMARVNIRKLRDHCLRTIHASRFGGDRSYDYYDLVTQLEKIAAEYYAIAVEICTIKKAKPELFFLLVTRFNELYECYLKKDLHKANALWEKHNADCKKYIETPKALSRLTKEPFGIHFYYLMKKYLHVASRIVSLCC